MDTQAFIDEAEQFGAHNYHPLPVVLTRGAGIHVWDVEGKRYVDMLSAYSALNQGHSHPKIVRAMVEQAQRLSLTSRAFHNDRLGPFLRRLSEVTGYERALPMNSGAEAVETAIKAARKWGEEVKGVPEGEGEIIVFEGNFHGRTTTIVGFSSEPLYRRGFGPFTPGFRMVPYGDADALRAVMSDRTVAVLVEPVQGEAGVVVPPEGFLRAARALCREHGALLIADEIQTGLGRTGRMFAVEWDGVRPDVMIVGKALGGGVYPVSARNASSNDRFVAAAATRPGRSAPCRRRRSSTSTAESRYARRSALSASASFFATSRSASALSCWASPSRTRSSRPVTVPTARAASSARPSAPSAPWRRPVGRSRRTPSRRSREAGGSRCGPLFPISGPT